MHFCSTQKRFRFESIEFSDKTQTDFCKMQNEVDDKDVISEASNIQMASGHQVF